MIPFLRVLLLGRGIMVSTFFDDFLDIPHNLFNILKYIVLNSQVLYKVMVLHLTLILSTA